MGLKSYFRQEYRKKGLPHALKAAAVRTVRKLSGARDCEKELDTLYYFWNQCMDITKVPKATGGLGDLQRGDTLLLGIFHKICEKNGLRYWLDWGTLLGAVRHRGFIPWDDDVDVAMPREDYDRAKVILKEEMGRYGISAFEREDEPMKRIGIGYEHKKTGIWIDVFPMDCFRSDRELPEIEKEFRNKVLRYRKRYKKSSRKLSLPELERQKKEWFLEDCRGQNTFWCFTPEFGEEDVTLYDSADLFPLKKSVFDDMEFYIPNHAEDVLRTEYGETWSEFPRVGLEHHGSDDAKLSEWARVSHTDMKEVCRVLKEIFDSITPD